jgi:hypothetical protein
MDQIHFPFPKQGTFTNELILFQISLLEIIYIDNKVCVNVALIFHNMFSNYLHDRFEVSSSIVQGSVIP